MEPSALRPLGVGEILDVAIKVYRARFGDLVKVVAVAVAPIFALVALVQLSLSPDEQVAVSGDGTTVDFGEVWTSLAAFIVLAVLGFVGSQIATAATLRIVGSTYLDEPSGWRESLRFATSRLRPLLWLAVVYGFLLVLAFLALVIPGIYLSVAWTVATPVLLFEGLRGRKALARSRALVRGRWWPTLGVLFLALLLTTVVQAVLAGLFTALLGGGSDTAVAVSDAIGSTISSALTTPFTAAVIAIVYFDLRVRKEGFDLELLARRVGIDPGQPPLPPDA